MYCCLLALLLSTGASMRKLQTAFGEVWRESGGSGKNLGIKMEQSRKRSVRDLYFRHGKRASSSGGASPLPLFHFLFLLLGSRGHPHLCCSLCAPAYLQTHLSSTSLQKQCQEEIKNIQLQKCFGHF